MNWITRIIKAGEKIKTAIHKRATKDDIANSDWTSCCKGPILKKDLEKNLLKLQKKSRLLYVNEPQNQK